jgi:predicted Zn-dependent peptidase
MQAQNRPQPKPGPVPVINVKKPETFTLANGLRVMIVENHKLPRVSFSLFLDTPPYTESNKKGVSNLTGSLLGNGSTKTPKDVFHDEVDFLGANISFNANGAFASSLSKYSDRVMELLAEGALMPNFTQEELDKEKMQLIESLRAEEKSVAAIGSRVRNVLAFGKNHPSGEYLSEATINNVTLDDVRNNYNTYFVPGDAYLVIIGDVNPTQVLAKAEDLFGAWEKASAPKISYNDPQNVHFTQINFVDVPNAVQSEISVVNTVRLQMKDPDFFPAVLANQVLGGNFDSYLNMNLREAHGWTYGAGSSIGGSRYPTTFFASAQVRNAVTDSAVAEFMKEIKRIRTERVSDDILKNIKAGYIGRFVMQVDKPQTIARYALNIATEGLPEDYYQTYFQKINAVTSEDIERVSKKYFMADNSRIIIVGKAADVLPGLEKLEIPIYYFDKFGNPVDKPATAKTAPATVTVASVLNNYIKAIGGEKAVQSIKSVFVTASATIPQAPAPLAYVAKREAAGRTLNSVSIGGMGELSRQVIGTQNGYTVNQGIRKELTAEEFSEKKAVAGTFEELSLLKKTGLTVEKIEPVNGKDAYVIRNGKTTMYYDVASGLKVMEMKTTERDGQTLLVSTAFDDYRDVNGVKFPYKLTMNQGIEINFVVSEIKINEGVSDADFQ